MKDAFIQGFLEQYYKNYDNVKNADRDSRYSDIQLEPSKMTNRIAIGWEGLSVCRKKWLDLSSPLYPLPTGRVTITNSWYITDNGTVYYNSGNAPSFIALQALLPNGLITNIRITLCSGWVELSKLDFLNANNQKVLVNTQVFNNVYIIHNWGGNVLFDINRSVMLPTVNENQVVVGYTESNDYSPARRIAKDVDVIRVYPSNTSLVNIAGGTGEAATRYVVLPSSFIDSTDVSVMIPPMDIYSPKTFMFKIEASSANFIFKVSKIISSFADEDVADLQNLQVVISNGGRTALEIQGGASAKWFKLTYLPNVDILGENWVLEAVTPVSTI